jgi:Probable zinc-ribbon domain/Tetratricopeptide repeat
MGRQKRSSHRGARTGKANTAKKTQASPEQRWLKHPLYGNVPRIRHTGVGTDGSEYEWWQCDPTLKPRLPPRAVEGDVTKQVLCAGCHVPKYFYVDEARRCIQCGDNFTFSGSEQKFWYEARQFNFHSLPIRCARCRRQRRTQHILREQIAIARSATHAAPDDPTAHLALARAIVEYHERTDEGRLDEAIAAARRAAKLWPQAPDARLWEGIAQARAGRRDRAKKCLTDFLDKRRGRSGVEARARRYLAETGDGATSPALSADGRAIMRSSGLKRER